MAKLFGKKEIFKVKSKPVEPGSMGDPSTTEDFFKRGMAYYARKRFSEAEADFEASISLDSTKIDAYYGLGMVCKAQRKNAEATQAFNKVLELTSCEAGDKNTRLDMLRRLALGHVNMINQGDWNLEKEIWRRIT